MLLFALAATLAMLELLELGTPGSRLGDAIGAALALTLVLVVLATVPL